MKKQTPLLPPTVVDQIRLWEMERNRLVATECRSFNLSKKFFDYSYNISPSFKVTYIKNFEIKEIMRWY